MKVLFEREDLVIVEQEERLVVVNSYQTIPLDKWYIGLHKGRLEEIYSKMHISDKTFEEASVCVKNYYKDYLA